jgi:hypothetical protein
MHVSSGPAVPPVTSNPSHTMPVSRKTHMRAVALLSKYIKERNIIGNIISAITTKYINKSRNHLHPYHDSHEGFSWTTTQNIRHQSISRLSWPSIAQIIFILAEHAFPQRTSGTCPGTNRQSRTHIIPADPLPGRRWRDRTLNWRHWLMQGMRLLRLLLRHNMVPAVARGANRRLTDLSQVTRFPLAQSGYT